MKKDWHRLHASRATHRETESGREAHRDDGLMLKLKALSKNPLIASLTAFSQQGNHVCLHSGAQRHLKLHPDICVDRRVWLDCIRQTPASSLSTAAQESATRQRAVALVVMRRRGQHTLLHHATISLHTVRISDRPRDVWTKASAQQMSTLVSAKDTLSDCLECVANSMHLMEKCKHHCWLLASLAECRSHEAQ